MSLEFAGVVPPEFFRGEPAHALEKSTFDLSQVDRGIQRAAYVVQDIHAQQTRFARQRVHRHFTDRRAIREIEERSALERLAIPMDFRCAVIPGGRQ
jgi:hypothetical protein